MLGQMESVLGADSTIESLCDDIVEHYEKYRANLLTGKAMIVAYSRPIAMKIYHRILKIRPEWTDKVGEMCIRDRLTSELAEMFAKSHELEGEIRKKLGAIGYEI